MRGVIFVISNTFNSSSLTSIQSANKMDDIFIEAAKVLGFDELRDFQRKASMAALGRKDVFVAMPTGSGILLAFQVLPFVKSGEGQEVDEVCFVLVISPINS